MSLPESVSISFKISLCEASKSLLKAKSIARVGKKVSDHRNWASCPGKADDYKELDADQGEVEPELLLEECKQPLLKSN